MLDEIRHAATRQRQARTLHGREFEGWFHTFAPGGHTPAPGEVVRFPEHAATLRAIGLIVISCVWKQEVLQRRVLRRPSV